MPTWVLLLVICSPWGRQRGSPYGKPYVIFKLSTSAGDNLGQKRQRHSMFLLHVQLRSYTAQSLLRCICRLSKVDKQFSPPYVSSSWRRFFMVSMEDSHQCFTSLPLKSIQSLLLLLSVGYHGYRSQMVWLVDEFVYECYLEGIGMFFFCAAKVNKMC